MSLQNTYHNNIFVKSEKMGKNLNTPVHDSKIPQLTLFQLSIHLKECEYMRLDIELVYQNVNKTRKKMSKTSKWLLNQMLTFKYVTMIYGHNIHTKVKMITHSIIFCIRITT